MQRLHSLPAFLLLSVALPCVPASAATLQIAGVPGELSITEITAKTVRISITSPGVAIPNEPELPQSRVWPAPALKTTTLPDVNPTYVYLTNLIVIINPSPLSFVILGRSLQDTVQNIVVSASGTFTFDIAGTYPLYGMGQGNFKQINRRGMNTTMGSDIADSGRVYGFLNPSPFLIGTKGWGLFMHRPFLANWDLRGTTTGVMTIKAATTCCSYAVPPLDLFVTRFTAPTEVFQEFYGLMGMPTMPPKWTMGYMQSHRALDAYGRKLSALSIAKHLRDSLLPCDGLIYLGTGYAPNGWNTTQPSFAWNTTTFPNPAQNTDSLHKMHFKISLHEIPGTTTVLQGHIPAQAGETVDNTHISTYWNQHRAPFALVDGWWPDEGEGMTVASRMARYRMYNEGPLSDRPNTRTFALHRTGAAGMTRYAGWIWTGDVFSQWKALAAHVSTGINTSMSLTPYHGFDIAGFFGDAGSADGAPYVTEFSPELFVRWFQLGSFTPLFRSHGRPAWKHFPFSWVDTVGYVEPACRKALNLRYQLLPYNYTLTRQAYDIGLPMIRALWIHYPTDAASLTRSDEYLWGRDILVAPVTQQGATQRTLYLPPGTWYDFWTNAANSGGTTLTRAVDVSTMPLYVRAGSILPLDPVRQYTDQPVTDPTTVNVYTGASGADTIYEDDGTSLGYQTNQNVAWTQFIWDNTTQSLVIQPDSRSTMTPVARTYNIVLIPCGQTASVIYSGQRVQTYFPVCGSAIVKNSMASQFSAFPSIFRNQVTFNFTTAGSASGSLRLFDSRGKTVRNISVRVNAGLNSVVWDGKGAMGSSCAPGLYIASLDLGAGQSLKIRLTKY